MITSNTYVYELLVMINLGINIYMKARRTVVLFDSFACHLPYHLLTKLSGHKAQMESFVFKGLSSTPSRVRKI